MTVKYEYKSACCNHEYFEQRAKGTSMLFPNCNECGVGNYELVQETIIANEIELNPGIEPETISEEQIVVTE